jgi:predicted RNase H-like nuclease (RuvC/YqgF family)
MEIEVYLGAFGLLQAIFISYLGWRQAKDKGETDVETSRISHQAVLIKAQTDTLVTTLDLAQSRLNDALRHNVEQVTEIRELRARVRQLEQEVIEVAKLRLRVSELEKENAALRLEITAGREREATLTARIDKLEEARIKQGQDPVV